MKKTTTLAAAIAAACLTAAPAPARDIIIYDFTIDALRSGIDVQVGAGAETIGTLIGNYDIKNNPTGTRTKPGLFGSFGSTENVAVDVQLGLGLAGRVNTRSSGLFRFTLDTEARTVTTAGYSADLLNGGSANLPLSIRLLTDSFRTRSPDSVFVGGIPIELPIGEVALTRLSARQADGPSIGVLTPLGGNEYDFAAIFTVEIDAAFDLLGTPFELPPTALPFGFQGRIILNGQTAELTSLDLIDFSQVENPDLMLPQFPFDLPTILPPGQFAHVLFDLLLSEVSFSMNGSLNTYASGRLVPSPAAAWLLLLGVGAMSARRRR